jgi:hypothetical protein
MILVIGETGNVRRQVVSQLDEQGFSVRVTDTVEQITGGPTRSFREWARDHAGDFDPDHRATR